MSNDKIIILQPKEKKLILPYSQTIPIKGNKGDNGLSAYQIAVNDGFEGTEQEWLTSLIPDLTPYAQIDDVNEALSGKVDKDGYIATDNNFSDEDKNKLDNLENYTLPSDVVQDDDYTHTDNNFSDELLENLQNQSGTNTGDQDLSGKADTSFAIAMSIALGG